MCHMKCHLGRLGSGKGRKQRHRLIGIDFHVVFFRGCHAEMPHQFFQNHRVDGAGGARVARDARRADALPLAGRVGRAAWRQPSECDSLRFRFSVEFSGPGWWDAGRCCGWRVGGA